MPITKYTGANLKKLKKDELISHIIDLYGFIDLFSNTSYDDTYAEGYEEGAEEKAKEIKQLKEENKAIRKENENIVANQKAKGKINMDKNIFDGMMEANANLKEEIVKLKEENKIQKQIIRETKRQMGYSVSDTEEEDDDEDE